MQPHRSPAATLVLGLAVTLSAVLLYSGNTVYQLRDLKRRQAEMIDRNRVDSLLLLRIQNSLNSLAVAMRDMLDATEPYPLAAWEGQFKRIRGDLEVALERERTFSPEDRSPDQNVYLSNSMAQFWDAVDRIFLLANNSREDEARSQIRVSLQARQAALSSAVARLLVRNNEQDQRVSEATSEIYAGAERNVYFLLGAMLLVVAATGVYVIRFNQKMFRHVAELAQQRSELAQQLISIQEHTFRYVSRELHDEFGQILTAIGTMMQRVHTRASTVDAPLREDLEEVRTIVQSTLEKVRALSHALHPVILDEAGFEAALRAHLPVFEKQTGIEIGCQVTGPARPVDSRVGIHLYRILQEALNNAARHAKASHVAVRLSYLAEAIVLEVEDDGGGFSAANTGKHGMGLVSMRERAELVNGRLEFLTADTKGALVRLTVPSEACAET